MTVAGQSMEAAQEGGEDEEDEGDGPWALPEVATGVGHPGGRVIRPGIVHRLDKGTTGLLVAAKDELTLTGLAAQFKAHTVLPTCAFWLVSDRGQSLLDHVGNAIWIAASWFCLFLWSGMLPLD